MARGVNKESEFDMYKSGMSIPDVSTETGIPKSTLRFRFKNKGVLRGSTESIRAAFKQGKIPGRKGIKREFTEEWCKNISEGKKGVGKGASLKPSGYIEITMGENKGRSEHRVIAEKMIGRNLKAGEVVHHVDRNKINNDISNLQVMTITEHQRHQALENNALRNRDNLRRYM